MNNGGGNYVDSFFNNNSRSQKGSDSRTLLLIIRGKKILFSKHHTRDEFNFSSVTHTVIALGLFWFKHSKSLKYSSSRWPLWTYANSMCIPLTSKTPICYKKLVVCGEISISGLQICILAAMTLSHLKDMQTRYCRNWSFLYVMHDKMSYFI